VQEPKLTLAESVEKYLGLKLESATAPVDIVVIDAVRMPTPN
jgi:uncharacterized protein (TIGR03435 family)